MSAEPSRGIVIAEKLERLRGDMAKWRSGAQVASLFRLIIDDFHELGIDMIAKKPKWEARLGEKKNSVTGADKDAVLREVPKLEHIAFTFRNYLTNTLLLDALQQEYKGGERSLEESAKLVGLKLPVSKP
ncbi:unnamed protein product [Gongylonema pulchrum]|uniref:Exocyst subunit Exo70 family protein n=1 Tax=Gongylonema pulchrum TaxID=637853 RepID=A0A183DSI6_9BILA|nr:unnamed protein product [Gongylonema pulchrum]